MILTVDSREKDAIEKCCALAGLTCEFVDDPEKLLTTVLIMNDGEPITSTMAWRLSAMVSGMVHIGDIGKVFNDK